MARRTHLQREDKRLLARIRGSSGRADERRWVLTHLDARAPTVIVQEIHAKVRAVSAPNRARTLLPQWGIPPTHLNRFSGGHLQRAMRPKFLTNRSVFGLLS